MLLGSIIIGPLGFTLSWPPLLLGQRDDPIDWILNAGTVHQEFEAFFGQLLSRFAVRGIVQTHNLSVARYSLRHTF